MNRLPIQSMYGAYTRTLNDSRPEIMKFSYADFGERTNNVSWHSRKDLLKKVAYSCSLHLCFFE